MTRVERRAGKGRMGELRESMSCEMDVVIVTF